MEWADAVADSGLRPLERLVMRELVNHLPDPHPSLDRLSARTGMARSSVCRALLVLEREGWITRRRTASYTQYILHVPEEQQTEEPKQEPETSGVFERPLP